MSVNCIRCVKNERTGIDLLCDECRDAPCRAPVGGSIKNLDIQYKQSIVDLLMDVQCGNVSCRRAATEIRKQVPKKQLTNDERETLREMRRLGGSVKSIAEAFGIDPSTVWRICKSNDNHEDQNEM